MVAEHAGVSERKAQQALTVVSTDPALADKVEKGEMSLREAAAQAKPPKASTPKRKRSTESSDLSRAVQQCKAAIRKEQNALPHSLQNPFRTQLIEFLESF